MALVSTIPAVAVRVPLGLMVMEQFAQLGSTAKEPKLMTALTAVTVIDCVLAEATGTHENSKVARAHAKANRRVKPALLKKVVIDASP
ncbi:hypothetical protein GCM10011496_38400 [Polaromonas eurypsychrophila]|uniref:Uncharacterized protein n=1 Tax=Polaromonas eurypsychrophila TaxID=1614635 RepID=A0A916WN05_9BURK|nr:hypothetical protein GCM10011496_38400 [Polaromonas eurypsychrophila]